MYKHTFISVVEVLIGSGWDYQLTDPVTRSSEVDNILQRRLWSLYDHKCPNNPRRGYSHLTRSHPQPHSAFVPSEPQVIENVKTDPSLSSGKVGVPQAKVGGGGHGYCLGVVSKELWSSPVYTRHLRLRLLTRS